MAKSKEYGVKKVRGGSPAKSCHGGNMDNTVWVYVDSEPGLYTVGFYDPTGKWKSESDHESREAAAARVHYLNGGDKQV